MFGGTSLIGRLVAASIRFPLIVLFLAGALAAAALIYTARHFAMTADTAQLISTKLSWRQRELAFPQLDNLTLVVVDGATPELADDAAARLAAALREKPALFHTVQHSDSGAFFDRNGLLLPLDDVATTMTGLVRAKSVLGLVAANPSLRGVLMALSKTLEGVKYPRMRAG